MIFIVEGADLSGKTTLINKLIKEFPGVLMKITDRPFDATMPERGKIMNHYYSLLEYLNKGEFPNVVLDRFFPSEIVYSIKRGYENFNYEPLKVLEQDIVDNWEEEVLLVYCDPGQEELDKRFDVRGDDYVSKEDNQEIHKRYERFYLETQLPKIKVDTNRPVEELVNQIKTHLAKF